MNIEAQNIKICFFDVDGTSFVNQEKRCTELDIYALRELKKKGYILIINTSRCPEECIHIPNELTSLMDGFIYGGGARIDYQGKTIISETIDQDDVNKALEYLEKNKMCYRWSALEGKGHFGSNYTEEACNLFQYLYEMCPTYVPYQQEPLINLLFYIDDIKQYDEISALVKNSHCLHVGKANEITANDVNKGTALLKLCEYLKISTKDTIAFGDGRNDVHMLQEAGIGVAMGNASDEVKAYADYVTKKNTESGIYHALVALNFIKE